MWILTHYNLFYSEYHTIFHSLFSASQFSCVCSLQCLGEHIKNWRKRYFILREDGTFYGFRAKPEHDMQDPLNNFTVRGKVLN